MRERSWTITCDRCGEPGKMPEEDTLPSGWMHRANPTDFEKKDFCPECSDEWRSLMVSLNGFYEHWFRGESLHQTLDLMGLPTPKMGMVEITEENA